MANFLRLVLGVLLLPACWGLTRTLADAILAANGGDGGVSAETVALLGGIAAFGLCWAALSHPVRAYVLGHELTHALWGLAFGARPSDLRVAATGGSVRLTKTNLLITLAPYFFPFYTFVVIVSALLTWAFHVLFTLETLTQSQPDVKSYGRVFSWTLIFIGNVGLVLVWLAVTTQLTFAQLGDDLLGRVLASYSTTGALLQTGFVRLVGLFRG